MIASDADVTLDAHDDDPQLIVPTPPPTVRMGNIAPPLVFSVLALIGFVAAYRRWSLSAVAAGVIACCGVMFLYTCASAGPRLPLFDDWRYVLPGRFNLVDGWSWLGVVGNDTYFVTNQLLDCLVLRLTNIDFYTLRLVAVAVLLLQIALQIRILLRATHGRQEIGAVAVAATILSLAAGAYWSGDAVIAYQQALPTLFGTLLLGFFLRADSAELRGFRSSPSFFAVWPRASPTYRAGCCSLRSASPHTSRIAVIRSHCRVRHCSSSAWVWAFSYCSSPL